MRSLRNRGAVRAGRADFREDFDVGAAGTIETNAGGGGAAPTGRHYRVRFRRRRVIALGVIVLAAVVALTVLLVNRNGPLQSASAYCTVGTGDTTYVVTPEQAQNGALISSVASTVGLPDHAVTVALATSLQESKLRNLTYGDRDSIGLFQQRPSQGWGTAEEIASPTYAATAFFTALRKIAGWETLDVAVAAQKVQRSADGTAYQRWEPEARTLASALTGQQPASLRCEGGTVTHHQTAAEIDSSTQTALGADGFAAGASTQLGWRTASYLIANTYADGITSVSYAGQTWTEKRGTWKADAKSTALTGVTFTIAKDPRTNA
jgi:hypothetical protein